MRDALDPPVITCILLLIGHGDALDPPVITCILLLIGHGDALDPPVITCILHLIGHGDALDPPVIMELRCTGVVPNKLSLSTENAGTHASANEARAHGIYEHTHG